VWRSFTNFLEALVRDYGLVRITGSLAGLAAILAAVGAAANETTLLVTVTVVLIALLLVTVTAQYVDRVKLYRDRDKNANVLDRYAAELKARQQANSFATTEWDEEQTVKSNGDTAIQRWLTLTVGPAPLHVFWHRAYSHARDMSERAQQRVKVEARTFDIVNGARLLGVEAPVTLTWEGSSVHVFVHLDHAPEPGAIVRIHLRFTWPRYAEPLTKQEEVARVEWTCRRPTATLRLKMRLPEEVLKDRRLAVTPYPGSPAPTVSPNGSQREVEFEMKDVPVGLIVGFQLQRSNFVI
jgi:hypothetical protein